MIIPKLEVLDEIPTNNFFITPQHSPAREIQQLNHHQQQQMFTTTSNNNNYNNYNSAFSDVYNQKQPHTTNNNGFSYSQDIANFTQNNTNYADIMNGLDNNIEKNLQSTSTECPSNQIQDIIDKRLQIRILGINQNGAKSRVETQIKLCLQLVTEKGEKVTCWSHLQLPEYMVAKEKFKIKNSKVPSDHSSNVSQDHILNLEASVVCASDTSKKVLTCLGCVQRERKRSQRKKENKKNNNNSNTTNSNLMQQQQPSTNDNSKSMDLDDEKMMQLEQNKILLFNCNEIVDFNSGDIILPTRITCYCRHHNEKVGFRICFRIKDHTNDVIATGMSPPIMITDDHKSSKTKNGIAKKRLRTKHGRCNIVDSNNSSKKKLNDRQRHTPSPPLPSPTTTSSSSSSIYGNSNNSHNNLMMSISPIETQPDSSLLNIIPNDDSKDNLSSLSPSPELSKNNIKKQQTPPLETTSNLIFSPIPHVPQSLSSLSNNANVLSFQQYHQNHQQQYPHQLHIHQQFDQPSIMETSASQYNFAPSINNENLNIINLASINSSNSIYDPTQLLQNFGCGSTRFNINNTNTGNDADSIRLHNSRIPNNSRPFYNTNGNLTNASASINQNGTIAEFQIPRMNKLIPSEGPVHGGIEVTVLGSNFYDGLTCVFGETPAFQTQFWSPNALVCYLPPSPTPGPVAVTFKEHSNQDLIIFNYTNVDTDRALMELALQVIGMKMTGKVEDALNIATRIVGNNTNNSHFMNTNTSNNSNNVNNANNSGGSNSHSTNSLNNDNGLLSIYQASIFNNFEKNIISLIDLMDVIQTNQNNSISSQDRQQHTMLHFAAMLGYQKLLFVLIEREIDLDVQDEYGFTALHYAAWAGRKEIVRTLLSAGADDDILNFNYQSPIDLAISRNFDDIADLIYDYDFQDSGVSMSQTSSNEAIDDSDDDFDNDDDYNFYDHESQSSINRGYSNENDLKSSSSLSSSLSSSSLSSFSLSNIDQNFSLTDDLEASPISWVESETAAGSSNNNDNEEEEEGIVDAEVVSVKNEKQHFSEMATDLASASTVWLQKTFAHLHMPNISKPSQINIHLPNIKMPNLQMPNLNNFSSPKFSTMNFSKNISIPRPSMPSMPSLNVNLEFPTVTFQTFIPPSFVGGFTRSYEKSIETTLDGDASGSGSCKKLVNDTKNIDSNFWNNASNIWNRPEGNSQQPSSPRCIGQDTTGFSRIANMLPINFTQNPEEDHPTSTHISIYRKFGYEPNNLNEDQLARLDYHSQKVKKLKQDKMLYLFWVPVLFVMIAFAIFNYNSFTIFAK